MGKLSHKTLATAVSGLFIFYSLVAYAGEMEVDFCLERYRMEKDSAGRVVLRVEGWGVCGEEGEPSLPALYRRYLLPPEAELSSVSVSVSEVKEWEMRVGNVAPAKVFLTEGSDKSGFINGEDPSKYGSDRFFPSEVLSVVGTGAAGR
ncbi:MAG: hypothetical protein N2234_07460, partial [Planctomycetota bacterium]|nr:hypothetical protein [Planctomycetota bacterium]